MQRKKAQQNTRSKSEIIYKEPTETNTQNVLIFGLLHLVALYALLVFEITRSTFILGVTLYIITVFSLGAGTKFFVIIAREEIRKQFTIFGERKQHTNLIYSIILKDTTDYTPMDLTTLSHLSSSLSSSSHLEHSLPQSPNGLDITELITNS